MAGDRPAPNLRAGHVMVRRETQIYREVAMAIAVARRLRPPMKVFANEMRRELGWDSLSRRAVYSWERGEAGVPAAALLAAAKVSDSSVDDLLKRARYLERLGLQPGE
jgi:hypothetical protein